eukprot:351761-Chlamydomonas_euryale.AAC.4
MDDSSSWLIKCRCDAPVVAVVACAPGALQCWTRSLRQCHVTPCPPVTPRLSVHLCAPTTHHPYLSDARSPPAASRARRMTTHSRAPARTLPLSERRSFLACLLAPRLLLLEPNVEAMRKTSEGAAHSASYNAELQLGNVRWAMLDVLRHPPPGFEDVVKNHFRLLRHRLMATTTRWVAAAGAAGATMQRRLDGAVCELHAALAAL